MIYNFQVIVNNLFLIILGTAIQQFDAILSQLDDWQLENRIRAICFDTTSVNTGERNGTCKKLRDKYNNKLLSLACRHHIMEIIISAVYSIALADESRSPNLNLFVRFKAEWNNINSNEFEFAIESDEISKLFNHTEKNELIEFILHQYSLQNHSRKDYIEFLELALIFLGIKKVNTKSLKIRPPGALHRARFMARVIYCLKIFALKKQFEMSVTELKGLTEFNLFVVKIYLKNWFFCTVPSYAPLNDLNMIKDLVQYGAINKPISDIAIKKLKDHLWYLGDILIGISFFDKRHENQTLEKMVEGLKKASNFPNMLKNKSSSIPQLCSFEISDLISERTMQFFEIICDDEKQYDFLKRSPLAWDNTPSFIKMKETIYGLSVVNDPAERAIGLIKDVNNSVTRDSEQQNHLIQLIENYRQTHPKEHPNTTKKTIIANLQK